MTNPEKSLEPRSHRRYIAAAVAALSLALVPVLAHADSAYSSQTDTFNAAESGTIVNRPVAPTSGTTSNPDLESIWQAR